MVRQRISNMTLVEQYLFQDLQFFLVCSHGGGIVSFFANWTKFVAVEMIYFGSIFIVCCSCCTIFIFTFFQNSNQLFAFENFISKLKFVKVHTTG